MTDCKKVSMKNGVFMNKFEAPLYRRISMKPLRFDKDRPVVFPIIWIEINMTRSTKTKKIKIGDQRFVA